ncbi:MAG: hypothetical protein AAGB02_07700 [Pseudomonadota bacterium]
MPQSADSLVVISHYDAHGADEPLRLFKELEAHDAGASYDVLIVVNQSQTNAFAPAGLSRTIRILHRENIGFNVGAWQHGWRSTPGYDFYLFLQDECVINRPGWLAAFRRAAAQPNTGFVGESMIHTGLWETYARSFSDTEKACRRIAGDLGVDLGAKADHLQTLAIGANHSTLQSTGGFIAQFDKVDAMAGEVLTSVRATAMGLKNRQVAWRPFEFIRHPQWDSLRKASARPAWSVSRALHLWAPARLNDFIPRQT